MTFGSAQGLRHEVVWTVLEGRDGSVWAATDDSGVQPSAWLERDGRLWHPTIAGVAVVDPRNVRDDADYWLRIETYARDHSDATLTHGICPDCAKSVEKHDKHV